MTISISRPVSPTSENDAKPAKVLESLPTRKAISQIIRDRVIAAGDPFLPTIQSPITLVILNVKN